MASSSAVATTLALTSVAHKRPLLSNAFFSPMKLSPPKLASPSLPKSTGGFQVQASFKEKAVTGLTAAALTAAMLIPDVAEAAQPGLSPSLKNFLLSIVAGGVVVTVIVGAVIGVANFDPVKRT